MTQTLNPLSLAGLSGWLTQILDELDTGAALAGVDFGQSLAAQIRSLMLKHGADPQAVAALDDQTLVAHYLALMADRQALPLNALGLGLAEPAGALAVPEGTEERLDPDDDLETEDNPVCLEWLPTAVLERLGQASAMLLQPADHQAAAGLGGGMTQDSTESGTTPIEGCRGLAALLSQAGPGLRRGEVLLSSSNGGNDQALVGLDAAMAAAAGTTDPSRGNDRALAGLDAAGGPGRLPGWLGQMSSQGMDLLATAGQVFASGLEEVNPRPIDSDPSATKVFDALRPGISESTPGPMLRSAADAAPTARAQVLDLNRLLQPGGEQTLAAQVRWSVEQGLETADIRLHPASLGSLEVRIVQDGDRTHVHFIAAHPVAREVLDAAVPRLRESLAQEGIWLGHVSVSDQAPRRDQGQGRGSSPPASALDGIDEEDSGAPAIQDTLTLLARRLDVFT